MDKKFIMLGMFIGSAVGSYMPLLWGAGLFSFTSILMAATGGILGIWLAFRFINS